MLQNKYSEVDLLKTGNFQRTKNVKFKACIEYVWFCVSLITPSSSSSKTVKKEQKCFYTKK